MNRFWFSGSLPFAALESSTFYPVYILTQFLFDAKKNLNTSYFFYFGTEMLHYLIASITFYLLVRIGLRLNKFSSLFGALIYSCSGIFIGRFVHTVVILTMSWLPLVFLFFFLYRQTKKLIFALLCSVVLSLIIVSGHPQMIYYVFLYFMIAIFYFLIFEKKKNRVQFLVISAGIIIISILLTAFKVFLTLELAQNIVRTTSETTIKNLYNSIHPFYYLTLFVPYLFGKHYVGYWGSDYPWGNWENYIYIGIIPILFLPFALKWKNKQMLIFFVVNLGITFFLLLGRYNWLSAFLNQKMPFSENMTMLSKFTNFFHFFLAIIATIGIHVGIELKKSKKALVKFFLYFILLLIVFISLKPTIVGKLNLTTRNPPTGEAIEFIAKNINQSRLLFIISSIYVLVYLLTKKKKLIYGCVLIYAFDIFLTGGSFNPIEISPGQPSQYFERPKIIEKISSDKSVYRIDNLAPRNTNLVNEIESTYGYHTIETKAYHDAISIFNLDNRNVIDLMNVKYLMTDQNLEQYENMEFLGDNLWKNNNFVPRIFFVPRYRNVENKEKIKSILTEGSFDPKNEVLLENYRPTDLYKYKNTANYPINYMINVEKYKTTEVDLDFNSNSDGFLVFSQFQYPGWYAKVSGIREKLFPADLFLYALPVKSGEYRIQFLYESKPIIYGAWLSGIVTIIISLTLIFKRFRKYYFRSLG